MNIMMRSYKHQCISFHQPLNYFFSKCDPRKEKWNYQSYASANWKQNHIKETEIKLCDNHCKHSEM